MKRKTFTVEFKQDAIQQAKQPGAIKANVAKSMGISVITLARWLKDHQNQLDKHPSSTHTDDEYEAVKNDLARVTAERDILKQMISLFISGLK